MGKTKIKICGLYREEDIGYVNQTMPDYAGFVFYEKSHRNVSKEQAKKLRAQLDKRIPAAGVFVNENMERIQELAEADIIQILQLHGQEDEEYIKSLRKKLPGCEIWKAFQIRSKEDLRRAEQSSADKILLDNGYGTGACFDWSLLGEQKRPFILAGGITVENAEEAIRRFSPESIDISSGVETEQKKDKEKIKAVIEKIRRM